VAQGPDPVDDVTHDKQEQVEQLLIHGSKQAPSENVWACWLPLAASSIAYWLERLAGQAVHHENLLTSK